MISPSRISMDFSSSLKRKRDHPSRRDDLKPLASLDRNVQQPWKHVKSELHRYGSVDGSVPNLSRLDKARIFAKKGRNGSGSGCFTSTNTDIRCDARNRERGVLERRDPQGSPSAPRKLGHGIFLKQNADEKQERVLKSAEEGSKSGQNLKRERLYPNDMTAFGSDGPRALGHGMNYDADRCLSQHRVLAHSDTPLEQSRMSPVKDCFKRIVKHTTKLSSGSDASKQLNFSRTRIKEEKHLAWSPSKSNNRNPDKISWKSSSSARAERSVAENPPLFWHVTRRARSERRRDDSGKSHSSKGFSLDGFCTELEEVLLEKQEAEVNSKEQPDVETRKRMVDVATSTPLSNNSGDAFISAALTGHKIASLLEEADEREEGELESDDEVSEKHFSGGGNEVENVKGELEPDDEVSEKHFSGGGNEVENVKGFEMHVEKTSQDCIDSETNECCKKPFDCPPSLSESSSPDITISASDSETHEGKIRQDCDGLENQKGCNLASGCLLLHSESSRHRISLEGSSDAREVVNSQTVPISDVVINSDVISLEEKNNGIDGVCQQLIDSSRKENMDSPAVDLDSSKYNDSYRISNAQQTDDLFLKIDDPFLFINPAPRRQRTPESIQSHGLSSNLSIIGDNQVRDSYTKTKGGENRDSVNELDEQKRPKVEILQLSLALPGCPSGSSKSLSKAVDYEVSRTQIVRRAQSLSHLRTESLSTGLTISLSLSSFVHNPSCSLNCASIEDQELSCVGSRQTFQVGGPYSDVDGESDVKKSLSSLSNARRGHKPVSPVYHEVLQDGKLLGSGIRLLSHTIGARGYGSNQAARRNYQCALDHENFILQDSVQRPCNEAPSFVLKSNSEGSKSIEGKSVSNVKIGLLEISSEPIAAMAQKLQELPDGFLEGLKGLVKDLLGSFAKREEFLALQEILRTRRDLTEETLLRAHPTQLEILVSLKTGMQSFVQQGAKSLTYKALIEIFLQTRCRNTDCQQLLPVDGCECTVCLEKKGFCHECMCMVCSKFDSDSNTCRWVGCDICMHWCHTDCGIRMSDVKLTLVSRKGFEFLEMQYQCLSCGHYMELYGFVKRVFENFAITWGAETLAKELDCVRRIFHGSEDSRGKQLCRKAEEMLQMLERSASIQDVCSSMLRFFSEDHTQSSPVAPKTMQSGGIVSYMEGANKAFATMGSLVARKLSSFVEDKKELEGREMGRPETVRTKDGSQDLHSIIGAKLTDVLMYQARADAAREDAIYLQHIISLKTKKMEEDHTLKSTKLSLHAAKEQQRKRLEELQAIERSHHDYEIMKLRIETDMKHLMMKIMERSRPQLA